MADLYITRVRAQRLVVRDGVQELEESWEDRPCAYCWMLRDDTTLSVYEETNELLCDECRGTLVERNAEDERETHAALHRTLPEST